MNKRAMNAAIDLCTSYSSGADQLMITAGPSVVPNIPVGMPVGMPPQQYPPGYQMPPGQMPPGYM